MFILLSLALLLSCFLLLVLNKSLKNKERLPPGPPRRWLVGNLFDMPKVRPWETYREWCEQYGQLAFQDFAV